MGKICPKCGEKDNLLEAERCYNCGYIFLKEDGGDAVKKKAAKAPAPSKKKKSSKASGSSKKKSAKASDSLRKKSSEASDPLRNNSAKKADGLQEKVLVESQEKQLAASQEKTSAELSEKPLNTSEKTSDAMGKESADLIKESVYSKEAGRDYEQQYRALIKKAEQGGPKVLCEIGMMHEYGLRGVQANPQFAINWYKLSAQKGCKEAQYHLGRLYYIGEGAARDYPQAYEFFLKAANQGHKYAQYMLSIMYQKGKGVRVDRRLAAEWEKKFLAAN